MKLLDFYNKKNRPLVLDGAMGGLLQQRGIVEETGLWSATANINSPEQVLSLHKAYVEAGAEIITTNTFRTNPSYIKTEYDSKQVCTKAVTLAREAIEGSDILIAGSNASAEDCYQSERTLSPAQLTDNHHEHIGSLIAAGVDLIWNETLSHLDEIEIVCNYCDENNYEYTLNLFVTNNLRILSGESLETVLKIINEYNPVSIGFNCIYNQTFSQIVANQQTSSSFGFYLNCGSGSFIDKEIMTGISPEQYLDIIKPYIEFNPLYIGSCCGSTPAHTKLIKETLVEFFKH